MSFMLADVRFQLTEKTACNSIEIMCKFLTKNAANGVLALYYVVLCVSGIHCSICSWKEIKSLRIEWWTRIIIVS